MNESLCKKCGKIDLYCECKSDPAAKAREIAEHVADIIWELPGGVDIREKGVELIASAIEAERQVGREEGYDMAHTDRDEGFKTGYRRGLEEMLEIVKLATKEKQDD